MSKSSRAAGAHQRDMAKAAEARLNMGDGVSSPAIIRVPTEMQLARVAKLRERQQALMDEVGYALQKTPPNMAHVRRCQREVAAIESAIQQFMPNNRRDPLMVHALKEAGLWTTEHN